MHTDTHTPAHTHTFAYPHCALENTEHIAWPWDVLCRRYCRHYGRCCRRQWQRCPPVVRAIAAWWCTSHVRTAHRTPPHTATYRALPSVMLRPRPTINVTLNLRTAHTALGTAAVRFARHLNVFCPKCDSVVVVVLVDVYCSGPSPAASTGRPAENASAAASLAGKCAVPLFRTPCAVALSSAACANNGRTGGRRTDGTDGTDG